MEKMEVGKKYLKQVTVGGKKFEMWVVLSALTEYDSNGKKIYYKDAKGNECWHEYDANGKLIHFKHSYGT